jgi:hypothetical protein
LEFQFRQRRLHDRGAGQHGEFSGIDYFDRKNLGDKKAD